jgi:hypothetical protein
LEQGPVEMRIIEQCVRDKMPIPAKMQNAPALLLGLDLFYVAFLDLYSCRSVGFGEGPIPWTAISEYCDRSEVHGEQREDMFYFVRALDNEYLKFKNAKAEAEK